MKKSVIAITIVVILVVAGIVIIGSSVPTKSQLNVSVTKVIEDHADEEAIGHSGNTAYILNTTISYKGSGTLDVNPIDFYIDTSNGTIEADMSGFSSNVTSPMKTLDLASGESTTGQIYFSISNAATFTSVYYSYDGQHYNAKTIPVVSQWVSYIDGVTVKTNDSNLSAFAPFIDGDYNSGSVLLVNISVTSFDFSSAITINTVGISPSMSYKVENALPLSVGSGDTVYLILKITMPKTSEYTGITVNIDATTS